MSVFWGMFAYSIATLAIVTGLSIKLALLIKECGELRLKIHSAERNVLDAKNAVKSLEAQMARYRKEIEVLRDELDDDDADLGTDGVADRLERLLSGEVPEDDNEDREGGDSVPTSNKSDSEPGNV